MKQPKILNQIKQKKNLTIIKKIRQDLEKNTDSHTKTTSQNFFKEKIKIYGVKTPIVTKISKQYFKEIKDLHRQKIFDLCEELLRSGYMEEAYIAFTWTNLLKKYEEKDFEIFEKWLEKYVDNWAECDTLCNHPIGSFIEQHPSYINNLISWTQSKNRWVRRGAAVSLILPARRGKFLNKILEIAERLLLDKDDLVQKGYGWMLKEASQNHQKEIFNFIVKHKKIMPRTALRYAIEKMPENLRKKAMSK